MESKRSARDAGPQRATAPAVGLSALERLTTEILESLPSLNPAQLIEAISAARERPAASRRLLFKLFCTKRPGPRLLAAKIILAIGDQDVRDNLSGVIFDVSQDEFTKVFANDLLDRLGSAVDPDVFAMSAPNAGTLREKLPLRTLDLLREGNLDAAVAHVRTLDPAERWLLMNEAAALLADGAVPFLRTLAGEEEANAMAAATIIAGQKLAAGVPLLMEIHGTANKDFQKIIKRLLFELRAAGVTVPEEERAAAAAAPGAVAEEDQSLCQVMMSDPSPAGLVVVAMSIQRPNGRLKVFSVLVDLWKRGIAQAALRTDISKSAFERFVQADSPGRAKLRRATMEECRRMVARGVRVARELDAPLPFDFGAGRAFLGDLDAEIAAMENPFLCAQCGKPLDDAAVQRIRAVSAYENIPPETRCIECRGAGRP